MAEARAEIFEHLRGERRRARDEEPHVAAYRAAKSSRRTYMVGTPKNSVGLKSLNSCGGLLVFEALEQAHPAAGGQPAVQAVAERVNVEKRQREQEAVGFGNLPAGEEIDGVGGEVVVREDRAFRDARGAGRVDQRGGGVAVERGHWPCRGCVSGEVFRFPDRYVHLREIGRHGNHRLRVGIGNDVGDLALAIEDVDRHEDHAGFDAGEVEVDQLERVAEVDAEAVACRQASVKQYVGEPVGARVDLAERVLSALPLKGHGVAAADQGEVE